MGPKHYWAHRVGWRRNPLLLSAVEPSSPPPGAKLPVCVRCVNLAHCRVWVLTPCPPGVVPSTMNPAWDAATLERNKQSPREGSETPMKLNPIHGPKK